MKKLHRWLLPEGIDEVLPPQARRLDELGRRLLDLFSAWGYELVMPPLVDSLDSLLAGSGADLGSQIFKFIDPHDGRLLGVRADITPQTARIDARQPQQQGPARLCYLGSALHASPAGGVWSGSRNLLQAGAELYGHSGMESDLEIICLAQEALSTAGLPDAHLELGHPGIFRTLANEVGLERWQALELFHILQRKAADEAELRLKEWLPRQAGVLSALCELHGDMEVLSEAERLLAGAGAPTQGCLRELRRLATELQKGYAACSQLHFDLGELRGFHYHTGVVFTAYLPGHGQGVAFGGRYDDVGKAFGRARQATGFSVDVKRLATLVSGPPTRGDMGILAPWPGDKQLRETVRRLRAGGERVIHLLSKQAAGATEFAAESGCNRILRRTGKTWRVELLGPDDPALD